MTSRSFAKKKKGGRAAPVHEPVESEADGGEAWDSIEEDLTEQLEAAVEFYERELGAIQVGVGDGSFVGQLKMEGGAPIKARAKVYLRDANTVVVSPMESSLVAAMDNAIRVADMDLGTEVVDGTILVKLPKVTAEARQALSKRVSKIAEEVRLSVRRARQGALSDIKRIAKSEGISKDAVRRHEQMVEKTMKGFLDAIAEQEKRKMAEIAKE